MADHPIQPVFVDSTGTPRFKRNQAVQILLRCGPTTLDQLLKMVDADELPAEDLEQLTQLIGYTVSGFVELDYTSDRVANSALAQAEALSKGNHHSER